MGTARMGAEPHGIASTAVPLGLVRQGISAELIAARWRISRNSRMDIRAITSVQNTRSQRFQPRIVSIQTPSGVVSQDETIRRHNCGQAGALKHRSKIASGCAVPRNQVEYNGGAALLK